MAVASAPRSITPEEQAVAQDLLLNARSSMQIADAYDQATVDRLCRAVAWAAGNEPAAARLASMSVDESGMGSREPRRRAKVLGVLRDALRQPSVGIIEELPDKGIAVRAGRRDCRARAGDQSYVTPITVAIYALKCRMR
jgi:sulfoacetaldehyde dehydrogenase